jgi:hypothetical protein
MVSLSRPSATIRRSWPLRGTRPRRRRTPARRCSATAWLAGQGPGGRGPDDDRGRALAAAVRGCRDSARASASGSTTGKRTSIAIDGLSAYSTSASASADPQSMHQCTGLHALLHVAVGDDAPERADDLGLEGEVHRQIGTFSQSPRTPRRLKSVRWPSTCLAA